MNGYIVQALTLQKPVYAIGIGMWLALIMAFNVWFIIWPNQKKALGIVNATAEEKAAAGRAGRHDLAHQHHAVDPDALLHGGAAERRPLIVIRRFPARHGADLTGLHRCRVGLPPRFCLDLG